MTIQTMTTILQACDRYIKIANAHGEALCIHSMEVKSRCLLLIRFANHMDETFEKLVWLEENSGLQICDPETRESIYQYAEEFGWTEKEIEYMRYGYCKEEGRN